MAVFVTGDIHSEIYPRFNTKNFAAQKELTKNDYVIVLGDFGIPWFNDRSDQHMLKELQKRNFTTLFIDGNHENYDYLNNLPVETWNGGKIHKINDSVYHLMRGQVFNIDNHTFFTFGGARSHDISDGIIENDENVKENVKRMNRLGKHYYRINHVSWWKEEMPKVDEFKEGIANLEQHNYRIDFVLTHDAPTSIRAQMLVSDKDPLSEFLQTIKQKTEYKCWYFGHMHQDTPFFWEKCIAIYETISQIT